MSSCPTNYTHSYTAIDSATGKNVDVDLSTNVDLFAYIPGACTGKWSCAESNDNFVSICISSSVMQNKKSEQSELAKEINTSGGELTKEMLYELAGDEQICVLSADTSVKFFSNQDNCKNACTNQNFTPTTNEVMLPACPPLDNT